MQRITLFEEYRLIERSEAEVNGSWKGAHLLLFFLAFVFGSFCTFCFHMLMYLFDEKCVLYPKLISINSSRQKTVIDFFPNDKDTGEMLPLDFLSTQWVDKTVCYLPTYVPLVSGIFGLVWTTMFLMCSTGSRTLTGLQRPWRVLPPVFIFSLAMGALCIYASAVTHYGLKELCIKLGEFTGSTTCSYTINVATLAYERRIRGVYQATQLTILSAWLHTSCWLLSALLALIRVLLAVDFQLVKINVELSADIDKMLERHERQVRTISPIVWYNTKEDSCDSLHLDPNLSSTVNSGDTELDYITDENEMVNKSELSFVPMERKQLTRIRLYLSVPSRKRFIVKILYDLLDTIDFPKDKKSLEIEKLSSSSMPSSGVLTIARQYGQELLTSKSQDQLIDAQKGKKVSKRAKQYSGGNLGKQIIDLLKMKEKTDKKKKEGNKALRLKSSTEIERQHKSMQTEIKTKSKKTATRKVQYDFKSDESSTGKTNDEVDKETQTKEYDLPVCQVSSKSVQLFLND